MDLAIANKVALVTGSTRGIGRAIAELLHSQECNVILNGRTDHEVNSVAKKLDGAFGIAGDLTNPLEAQRIISQTLDQYGRLDILVCNVGGGQSVPPGLETFDEWQRIFSLNLWSTTNIVEAARDALVKSKGSIICISSICGLEVIPGAPVTYSAAKAALHAYVRGVARPLGEKGVRINAIASGNIEFEGSVWSTRSVVDSKAVDDMLRNEVPLRRLGVASEVASLVAFLASPISSVATGHVWTIDGGQARS